MNVTTTPHPEGFTVYTVRTGNSVVELSDFGGQLLGWTENGVSIIFLNAERAILDGKTAYRGGAPVCFPYFGKGTLLPDGKERLPAHGRARTSIWDAEVQDSAIVFRITQPSAEGYGPTNLTCELTYTFENGIGIEARIVNAGEKETPFQFAIHTYWACADPSAAVVESLGERYLDNLQGFKECHEADNTGVHQTPYDRVYPDAAAHYTLKTEGYRLSISTENCAGAVLWNPGENHTIADLAAPAFVCLESGVIVPARVIAPGEERRLRITYHVQL